MEMISYMILLVSDWLEGGVVGSGGLNASHGILRKESCL